MTRLRVGQGFDAHRFGGGGPLTLCGCVIDEGFGLEGHSDADVGFHAVADALLGAAALGDLGEHFPENDPRWSGADSGRLLAKVGEMVSARGFSITNCDLTIIGRKPRIAPHRAAMRTALARVLGMDAAEVSIKATTTDGLGFTGRGEGLAAMAVVLIVEGGDNG